MKPLYILILTLFLSNYAFGTTIPQQTAQQIALNFFKLRATHAGHASETAQLQYQRIESDGVTDYYVFNMQPVPGFVIVAATDNVTPVLGYSTESNFVYNAGADVGFNTWLNTTARKVHSAVTGGLGAYGNVAGLWGAYQQGNNPADMKSGNVGPLLTTTWDQGRRDNNGLNYTFPYYYNNLCPDNVCPAGCGALAVAQILNYYQCPAQGIGSNIYSCGSYGNLSANFGATTYPWAMYPPVIASYNYLSAGALALDTFIYQCGIAVNMQYAPGNSNSDLWGSASALNAFVSYFGYNANTIQAVTDDTVTGQNEWFNLIQAELYNNRVVEYRGYDNTTQEGHLWVCDGYETSQFLHMNWGWGGLDNGFYQVGYLNPDANDEFNTGDDILIGIEPVGCSTGINPVQTTVNKIELSPNPVSDWLTVKINSTAPVTGCAVNIFNTLGQLVNGNKLDMNTGDNSLQIPVNNLAAGVYFVSVQTGDGYVSQKFVRTE